MIKNERDHLDLPLTVEGHGDPTSQHKPSFEVPGLLVGRYLRPIQSPPDKHGHDDALVRKGMRPVLRGSRMLRAGNVPVRGELVSQS